MKTLYIECNAGASGDMFLGALADLLDDPTEVCTLIEGLGIPGISCKISKAEKSMITGSRVEIDVDGIDEGDTAEVRRHHRHHALGEVREVIRGLNAPENVIDDALSIYDTIAEAESRIHGKPVNEVHFHEVGALDAIADVVGACLLVDRIGADRIVASPLRTGYGEIECAHGRIPVPAPATSCIITGMPVFAGDVEGEFTTPTGAAIVKHFADAYGPLPDMTIEGCGYGIGKKDMPIANMMRAFVGTDGAPATEEGLPLVSELSCEIDDMVPEDLGGVADVLVSAGALDAFVTPVFMKKGRPGYLLTCVCRPDEEEDLARIILTYTTTIGIRAKRMHRYEMQSTFSHYMTDFGDVRVKVSEGFGIRKWKPEHADLAHCAEMNDIPITEVRSAVKFDPDEEDGDD